MTTPTPPPVPMVPVGSIQVGERDRTDLGDVAELAESIRAVGLLHPVVVTADMTLVAGDRRLAAVRRLGWTEVPVTVVDLETAAEVLRAEADENTCRKPLTPYEASRARERRAAVLAEDAAKRAAEGRERGRAVQRGESVSPKLGETNPKTRETAKLGAIGTGYSGSTLDKVDRIRDVAERGIVRHGKTETPAPEPVREVARQALTEVQQTGAAVDRAARKVEQALGQYIDESPDVQRAKFRRSWRGAFSAAMELEKFDPDRVAGVLDPDEWAEVQHAIEALHQWYTRLTAARHVPGLRVVGGGDDR